MLVNYGLNSLFVFWILFNDIGECVIMELCKWNVDISKVLCGGECLGIYFFEIGVVSWGSKVVYDWVYFGMVIILKGMINWEEVFEGVDWFYWMGIIFVLF